MAPTPLRLFPRRVVLYHKCCNNTERMNQTVICLSPNTGLFLVAFTRFYLNAFVSAGGWWWGGGGWQSGKVGGRRRGLSADWFICAAYLPLGWQAQRKRRRAGEGHEAVRGGGHMEPQGQQGARSEQQRQAWKMMVNMHREQPNGFLQSAHWDRRYPSQPRAIQTGFPHWCLKPIRTTESRGTPFIPPLERGMRRVFDAPREKSLGASLRSTAPPSVRTHRSRCWRSGAPQKKTQEERCWRDATGPSCRCGLRCASWCSAGSTFSPDTDSLATKTLWPRCWGRGTCGARTRRASICTG